MNRREAIKTISLLGVGLMNPFGFLMSTRPNKPFHFIGLGGAGSVLAEHFFHRGLPGRYTCIDGSRETDLPLEIGFVRFHAPAPEKELFGHRLYEVSDLKKKPDIPLEIKALVEDDAFCVVLAGFGGFTGSYLSMHLSGLFQLSKRDHIMLGTMPFSFEGKHTLDIANFATSRISQHSNLLTYKLDDIRGEYGNAGLQVAFRGGDEMVYSMFIGW